MGMGIGGIVVTGRGELLLYATEISPIWIGYALVRGRDYGDGGVVHWVYRRRGCRGDGGE